MVQISKPFTAQMLCSVPMPEQIPLHLKIYSLWARTLQMPDPCTFIAYSKMTVKGSVPTSEQISLPLKMYSLWARTLHMPDSCTFIAYFKLIVKGELNAQARLCCNRKLYGISISFLSHHPTGSSKAG